VALKYGKDSREYEMTGGVRKSDACGGHWACRTTSWKQATRSVS
jgi:hypothetical protein